MSLNTSSAYPRQMTGASDLWKTLGTQGLGSGTAADEYDAVDSCISRFPKGMNKAMSHRLWTGVTGVTPKTFRIVCEEIGFMPKTVEILIQGKVIQVFGLVKVKLESGVTTTKEFCKAYQLPHYVLSSKYTILFSEHGHLLIDFPILTDTRAYPGAGGRFEEAINASDAEWKNPETECLSISIYKSAPKTGRFPKSNAYKRMGMGNADVDEYSMPQWNMSKRVPSGLTGASSWDSNYGI